jgi:AraC-like DNA-binding protein
MIGPTTGARVGGWSEAITALRGLGVLVESLIHGLLPGSADPAYTTMAAIAHRWGFTHLGRFAAAHKMKFGNTPVQALHAAR